MVLVDTSVWVDHLRRGDAVLASLLHAGEVLRHPFVVGELACGGIRNRSRILRLLQALPAVPKAQDDEVLLFIDRHRLAGAGLGLIDMHLLASCLLAGAALWTRDARLAGAAAKLGLASKP
ncbi:MAG: type II toxin-antitoxin system VapC family toxin [Planctomycetes bacterium]|nr:type II toxin-antitoxin system VapC family toxin [Planctomycetota bacterium]